MGIGELATELMHISGQTLGWMGVARCRLTGISTIIITLETIRLKGK